MEKSSFGTGDLLGATEEAEKASKLSFRGTHVQPKRRGVSDCFFACCGCDMRHVMFDRVRSRDGDFIDTGSTRVRI